MKDVIINKIKSHQDLGIVFVGIDGPGGVGKTTLAQQIKEVISDSQIVHMDDFDVISDRKMTISEFRPVGPDTEWRRVLDEVILPLRSGQSVEYVPYDREKDRYKGIRKIVPRGVVVVEGVFATRRELLSNYDVSIWMECAIETRIRRAIARDGESSRELWESDWIPMEEKYVSIYNPQNYVDFVYRTD